MDWCEAEEELTFNLKIQLSVITQTTPTLTFTTKIIKFFLKEVVKVYKKKVVFFKTLKPK